MTISVFYFKCVIKLKIVYLFSFHSELKVVKFYSSSVQNQFSGSLPPKPDIEWECSFQPSWVLHGYIGSNIFTPDAKVLLRKNVHIFSHFLNFTRVRGEGFDQGEKIFPNVFPHLKPTKISILQHLLLNLCKPLD